MPKSEPKGAKYRNDPVAYAREVHGIWLWGKLARIAQSLVEPPHWVMAKSANGIGKTKTSAILARWFYDCFDPGECIITGPRFDQLRDTTFKEIRSLSVGDPELMPRAPRLESSPSHYVNATTANTADAFQGIHSDALMLLFEEAMGIDAMFWEAARGIRAGGQNTYWFAYLNPTDPSGHAFREEQSGRWRVYSVSAFEHPNIAAELTGRPAPIPAAVRLAALLDNMHDWGDPSCAWPTPDEVQPTDVDLWDTATYGVPDGEIVTEVAPGEWVPILEVIEGARRFFPGRHWRPGPIGEARILGRYPRFSAYAIFSEALFDVALRARLEPVPSDELCIGCDVARFGDDATAIHARHGRRSIHHASFRKRDTGHTAGELKNLAQKFAPLAQMDPKRIPILIDDNGLGGGVTDQAGGYNFIGINGQEASRDERYYKNVRSEMLFDLADGMGAGNVAIGELDRNTQSELRQQALGITYKLDSEGRRVAEETARTKERLGRSPDDLVAMALCYYQGGRRTSLAGATSVPIERRGLNDRGNSGGSGRGLIGRR